MGSCVKCALADPSQKMLRMKVMEDGMYEKTFRTMQVQVNAKKDEVIGLDAHYLTPPSGPRFLEATVFQKGHKPSQITN